MYFVVKVKLQTSMLRKVCSVELRDSEWASLRGRDNFDCCIETNNRSTEEGGHRLSVSKRSG